MSTLYLFVGALFSPFIGVVSLLGSLFKYVPTKTTIVCFCFIISIIGIYWFPWGDAQSHFSYYYSDFIERYFDFSFISIFSSYWFYDWVIFQIASVTGNYVYGYMFWLFFPLAFYASAISWFEFKNAEISLSKEERDMCLYKATRYGQVVTRML